MYLFHLVITVNLVSFQSFCICFYYVDDPNVLDLFGVFYHYLIFIDKLKTI